MSWAAHGVGAARIGGEMIAAGSACLVHAIVPGWFTQTPAAPSTRIHDEMLKRKAGAANPNDWPEYEI